MTDHKERALYLADRLSGRDHSRPILSESEQVNMRAEINMLVALAHVEAVDAQVAATLLSARVVYLANLRAMGVFNEQAADLEDAIRKGLGL